MEQIKLSDINFHSLQKLKQQGTKSTLYKDGNVCYKILDGLYDDEKESLYKKLLDMDGIKIDSVLLPKELIVKDGKLQGYTMDYFPNSIPLSDRFSVRYVDSKKLFDYVLKASKILRTIHNNDIICQDLSFENILVDSKGNVAFCDLDGCSYKNRLAPFISMLIKRFLANYRNESILLDTNLDRISMMLSFYHLIYDKELQEIGYTSNEIRKYKKITNYDEIVINQ